MSENAQQAGNPQDSGQPYQAAKPKVPWPVWKTVVLIVIGLAAVGLTVNSSVRYEAAHKNGEETVKPPPTYTDSAPLAISKLQEAWDSNNDFVIVFTACGDAALNESIKAIAIQAGDKIRSVDRIYVGVFTMPANESLTYPTITIRLLGTETNNQYTMRSDITLDKIYDQYLDRKFLRDA